MKHRGFLCSLGIISFSAILSVLIYAYNISESKPKYDSVVNSLSKIYPENKEVSEIKSDKIFESSALMPEKQQSSIRVISGFKSLSTYAECVCYHNIKLGCSKVLNERTPGGCYAIAPIVVENCRLDSSQLKKVLYAVRNDYPEFFWISSSFGYMYPKGSTVVRLNSTFSPRERQNAEEELNKKVDDIISKASAFRTDYEKELFFHDYLITNCKYESNYESLEKDSKIYSSYGCLIDGRAVCEGYSSAMQLLLNSVGIDARTVSGFRGKEPHMWNLVKIDNDWYNVDVTWDGSGEFQKYFYFNVSDNVIKLDHIVNEQLGTKKWPENKRYNFILPACNSYKHNYFEKNAFKFSSLNSQSMSALTEHMIKLARKKCDFLYVMVNKRLNAKELVQQDNMSKEVFKCIANANRKLDLSHRITNKSLRYSVCRPQNVIAIKLMYD